MRAYSKRSARRAGASRRGALRSASFDHGAQYLTAADAGFSPRPARPRQPPAPRDRWQPDWPGSRAAGRPVGRRAGHERTAAVPRPGSRRRVRRADHASRALLAAVGHCSTTAASRTRNFAAVALAMPAPAAAALAGAHTAAAARVAAVPMAPCWAALVAFDAALPGVPDAAFDGRRILAWYARNCSKARPRAAAIPSCCTRRRTGRASSSRRRRTRSSARSSTASPSTSAGRCRGRWSSDSHRWRHARVEIPLGEDCLFDPDSGIGFCGDWCLDARAEAAWFSGRALGAFALGGAGADRLR